MLNFKPKFRLIPIFIFICCLSLSIKISNVFDNAFATEKTKVNISGNIAYAKDKFNNDTNELNNILDKKNKDATPDDNTPSFSNSELMILQELAERREALDLRAKEIDKRAIQLKIAKDEINQKILRLKEYEQRLEKLINKYNDKEKENVNSLVKLYSTMKPKDAARIFNTMEIEIIVTILKGMKPSTSSSIIAQMNSDKARAITTELMGNNI